MYEQADLVVKLSSRLLPSYVGRVEKRGQATLVITSAIFEDSTIYRCRLEAKDGGYNESYIQLVVIGMAYYQLMITSAFKKYICLSFFKNKGCTACQNNKSCVKDLISLTCFSCKTQKMHFFFSFFFFLVWAPKRGSWCQALIAKTVETGDKYLGVTKDLQGRFKQ